MNVNNKKMKSAVSYPFGLLRDNTSKKVLKTIDFYEKFLNIDPTDNEIEKEF